MEPLTDNQKAMANLMVKTMVALLGGIEKHCESFCEVAGSSTVPLLHIQTLHKIALQPWLDELKLKELKPIDPHDDLGGAKDARDETN